MQDDHLAPQFAQSSWTSVRFAIFKIGKTGTTPQAITGGLSRWQMPERPPSTFVKNAPLVFRIKNAVLFCRGLAAGERDLARGCDICLGGRPPPGASRCNSKRLSR